MRLELRMKYCETVYKRYHKSSKESKGKILDELCQVCGYNRKYAIDKLNKLRNQDNKVKKRRNRSRKYSYDVLSIVESIWKASNYPWSLRLKEIIYVWLPWIREEFKLSSQLEEKLLSISPSTIDRYLKAKKKKLKRRIYGRTKPGTLLRHKIPVKTDNWDIREPGFLEADLVSHSGGSGRGEFIYSLNLTDICTGWVETEAVMGKGEKRVIEALEKISQKLPFKILGIDSDNGSEFINYQLYNFCEKNGIQFTRSRPYKKDDNAHIEQKNWTHVRKLMGWDRYDSPQALKAMNELYEKELPLFMNMFQPSVQLKRIIRKGSRKHRVYDNPKTPLDRLLAFKHIEEKQREQLKQRRNQMNPFLLSKTINRKLQLIWSLVCFHYNPKEPDVKTKTELKELSASEKETLEDIAQVFGINVYIRTHKGGKLIALGDG